MRRLEMFVGTLVIGSILVAFASQGVNAEGRQCEQAREAYKFFYEHTTAAQMKESFDVNFQSCGYPKSTACSTALKNHLDGIYRQVQDKFRNDMSDMWHAAGDKVPSPDMFCK